MLYTVVPKLIRQVSESSPFLLVAVGINLTMHRCHHSESGDVIAPVPGVDKKMN
jgi:hypothetical protein